MHYGRSNPNFDYYTRDSQNLTKRLEKTEREKDLGVTFTSDLNSKEEKSNFGSIVSVGSIGSILFFDS